MAKQKWRNRVLERGVIIDRACGYVYVRFKSHGIARKELIGRATDVAAIDQANFRAQQIRQHRRTAVPGFEMRRQRMLAEDAADVFLRLHGMKRQSRKGIKQFVRHVRLIKEAWQGRYIDTLTPDDMRDYREARRRQGVSESTINREHTAITTMFNRLADWRRAGQISRQVLLPLENPGRGVRKTNEDRFIRQRLLGDDEFENLWANADGRLRRIIMAEMNLPLRLEDLRQLRKSNIHHKLAQFRGTQTKTGRDYALPINAAMWELIRSAAGDLILDFSGFACRWARAVRRAGLKGLQFRDLRRTAATALHDGGVPLRTISAMLGHASVTTTVRYLGLKNENLKQAGDLLANKYRVPLEGTNCVESVPKSVPTAVEKMAVETIETMREVDNFGGVAQMVRAAAS